MLIFNDKENSKTLAKTLGVYIPTYNRPDKVKELLEIIIPNFSKFKIQIYISDNSENDQTEKIVSELKTIYPNITYMINRGDRTYESNFLNLLLNAKTEYMWFLSDDDRPEENSIDILAPYLTEGYDFILVYYSAYNSDFTKVSQYWKMPIEKEVVFTGPNLHEAILSNYRWNGFISFTIMKTRILLDSLFSYGSLPNTPYIQTLLWSRGVLLNKNTKKGIALPIPIVKWREVYVDNGSRKSRFYLSFEHRKIFQNISEETKNLNLIRAYDGPIQLFLVAIGIAWKAKERLNLKEVLEVSRSFTNIFFTTTLMLVLVSFIPKKLAIFINNSRMAFQKRIL